MHKQQHPQALHRDVFADGTAATARSFAEGELWLDLGDGELTTQTLRQ